MSREKGILGKRYSKPTQREIQSPAEYLPADMVYWIDEQRKILARPTTLVNIRLAVHAEAVRIRKQLLIEADRMHKFCDELQSGEVKVDLARSNEIYGAD
jgi:hypothetical protein